MPFDCYQPASHCHDSLPMLLQRSPNWSPCFQSYSSTTQPSSYFYLEMETDHLAYILQMLAVLLKMKSEVLSKALLAHLIWATSPLRSHLLPCSHQQTGPVPCPHPWLVPKVAHRPCSAPQWPLCTRLDVFCGLQGGFQKPSSAVRQELENTVS